MNSPLALFKPYEKVFFKKKLSYQPYPYELNIPMRVYLVLTDYNFSCHYDGIIFGSKTQNSFYEKKNFYSSQKLERFIVPSNIVN